MTGTGRQGVGFALGALLASTATLVCCVLPTVFVAVGAGAALVGLLGALPQLVWLSEHKALVFLLAAAWLLASGAWLWRARRLPCPTDPLAAASCLRLRRRAAQLYSASVAVFLVGAGVAYVLPAL